jgi:ATP-binding cassette, subfamily A (ABC1), member 3
MTFQIPMSLSSKFKEFFENFDKNLEQLGIRSYGISITTLEEVFLRVGHGNHLVEDTKT